ncbi:hypothetical protein T492DRAFT_1068453 [Pavlovales sp. CCMP2436]|nr:hypothetical protein T492DRAFT_1068453 [Pavlovales sp. CCMP2436]
MRVLILALVLCARAAAAMRVALTGASGYVGCEIAHQLVEAGHSVLALARPGGAGRVRSCVGCLHDATDDVAAGRCVLEVDLTDSDALVAFGTEALIHTAAVFQRGLADPDGEMVVPTIAMAALAARACAAAAQDGRAVRLVHTSSMAAVRGAGQPVGPAGAYTSTDVNTVSRRDGPGMEPYQFAKTAADAVAARLSAELRVELVTLCSSMIFVPFQHSKCACGADGLERAAISLLQHIGMGPTQTKHAMRGWGKIGMGSLGPTQIEICNIRSTYIVAPHPFARGRGSGGGAPIKIRKKPAAGVGGSGGGSQGW